MSEALIISYDYIVYNTFSTHYKTFLTLYYRVLLSYNLFPIVFHTLGEIYFL